ncbi:MAG TPA: DNA-formamidopyrimidine glycosylase [Candidatus Saccharimonadales bacterium]|nr:DNA-formamidopyrimidine glycosylase [Candidatus Saccharimonadales bacterium]
MPELPEVETIRIGLSKLLPGKIISKVDFDWPKSFPNAPEDVKQFLVGARVVKVARRAKVLLIELSSKYSLVIHLKMTGQLVFVGRQEASTASSSGLTRGSSKRGIAKGDSRIDWIPDQVRNDEKKEASLRFGGGHPNDSLVGELPVKSTRVTFEFTDGSKLFFNDQRKFGWVRLMPTAEVVNLDFFKKVGPEPLSAEFTWQVMKERLMRRKNSNIKAVLLDQTVLAGVGNIYADESLWAAKIHPATLTNKLSDRTIYWLHKSLQDVLQLSIDKGGSTDKNYVDAEGRKGSYLSFAKVFRRDGQPCPRCGTTIIKTRVAGRGTHLCPKCQKL